MSVHVFCPFSNWVVYYSFDCLFYVQVLCLTCDLQIFSAPLQFVFSPCKLGLAQTKVFNFAEISFFPLWIVLLVSHLRTLSLALDLEDFISLYFFPKIFIGFLDFYLSISFSFRTIVNSIVFLYVHYWFIRNKVDFCVLICSPAELIISTGFW